MLPNVKNAILAAQAFMTMQHKPLISIVVSMTDERVIGKNNMIPWHITKDLVRFKNKCLGRVVIMGRKTFDSLVSYYDKSGRPLPGKTYIIVTADTSYVPRRENTIVASSLKEALQKAKELEKEEIIIAGGSSIYTQALPFADKLYLTLIHMRVDGDAFFPEYSMFAKVTEEETFTTEDYSYTFLTRER